MDCEKFDQHALDALYDELDELTSAALRRHVEGCSRCAGVWSGLRATREVGVLPLVEPPDDLEARILDAVAVAQTRTPLHKRVLRGLAWAGSHAMRPQLAMAALFFLVIGSSLLLLRAPRGAIGPVSVTERGAPMAERAAAPPPAAMAAATAAPAAAPDPAVAQRALADDAPADRSPAGKTKAGEPRKPSDEGGDDARAALADARATRDTAGCSAAVGKLDAVAVRFSGTQAAADAMWDEAACYKQMGDTQRAQQIYLSLRSTGYHDRAEQELAAIEANNPMSNVQSRVAGAAPRAAAPAPPAAGPQPAATAQAEVADRGGANAPPAAKAMKKPAAGAPNPKMPAAPSKLDSAFAP
jgi:hypothetical protein